MRLGNPYFTEVLDLATRLADLLRSANELSNTNAEIVKELTLLCAELDFTQLALQNLGTLLIPTLAQCVESRVVQCSDTLSQVLAMSVNPSQFRDGVLELFRIQITQLRTDLRRLLVSGILSGVHEEQYNRNVTELTVTGGTGGMGGPGSSGGTGGNGEGPRLIADKFIVGTLIVKPGTSGPIARGIHDHLFWVIDPVGGSVPISLRYCQTYVELDRILKACLAGRPDVGTHYVVRGDYGLVLEDGEFLTPWKFTKKIVAGIRLEMSILKRQFQDEDGATQHITCPHCRCSRATETEHGWYKCDNNKCAKNYRIESQDVECEELVSPALAHQDEAQLQSFLRIHIQLIHIANPIASDVPDAPRARSLTTRIINTLNWLGSGSQPRT
ncbi:hypothetical protein MSAN_01611000 [Mycena sanguinolenta]|uniref:Ubiquitin-like domain-containing protein n=1 Tax=Mycena sanguinolenta TaxID=230812 RepID=A0A8H7CXP2_9AGAR|nr:hypothetical protein MSAN_01611000 [Mycena sanguinolenta]